MQRNQKMRFMSAGAQSLWNLRWPAVYLCGPVLGVLLINLWFGLPSKLWFVAALFFVFSLLLFGVLMRAEIRQVRSMTRQRGR